jgi:RimJ/RimL family protein N-acetyltransferase
MNSDLFTGKLVHLTAEEPKIMAEAFSRWARDSEYLSLLDTDPHMMFSQKKWNDWLEKELDKDLDKNTPNEYFLAIRILEDERLIGFIGLWDFCWTHGTAWVSIGIGERDCWGKGYGTDAMRLLLRYAFIELNLHRVQLYVFSYNERAIHTYLKAGFKEEACFRQAIQRKGNRWDDLLMGILRPEWEALNG